MYFKFQLKQKACCGGADGKTTLTSANYPLAPENVHASIVRAFDNFSNNYHSSPIEIFVTTSEIKLMQQQLDASEFSITNGKLQYRRIPITIKE